MLENLITTLEYLIVKPTVGPHLIIIESSAKERPMYKQFDLGFCIILESTEFTHTDCSHLISFSNILNVIQNSKLQKTESDCN